MCYSCSVQCHGEHTLVEIFQKRNFTCDCGTTRFPLTAPCAIQHNDATKTRGGVSGKLPDANNRYNHNFRNRFCACECDYDPYEQKGTMFQCMGLGTADEGGCGEDWYHPGCLVGLGPKWFEGMEKEAKVKAVKPEGGGGDEVKMEDGAGLPAISEEVASGQQPEAKEGVGAKPKEEAGDDAEDEDDDDAPLPHNFPSEDDFEGFLCYKCVDAHPWIKQYAGSSGFLPPVYVDGGLRDATVVNDAPSDTKVLASSGANANASSNKKRKVDDADDIMDDADNVATKRHRSEAPTDADVDMDRSAEPATDAANSTSSTDACKLSALPPAPTERFSLFFTEQFRDFLCRCNPCYLKLNAHPQLLEDEEVYEPPLSENGDEAAAGPNGSRGGGSTRGSGSLYERGESALRNVDRVRAIEGVMAYNHLKEQLKPFFAQFAGSGQAISADDIKEYFAKLRGDDGAIAEAGARARGGGGGGADDGAGSSGGRTEQSGY
jgi:E3 ubiquitin-protein ligase UBR7